MNLVYSFENSVKSKVSSKVEGDKFGDACFAKAGFVFKDGAEFGLDGKTLLIVRSVDEAFKKHAEEILKEIESVELIGDELAKKVIDKINEEEQAAQSGFGSIFG